MRTGSRSRASAPAEHILIAVGGRPSLPELPGIEHAITSDDVLERLGEQARSAWR